MTKMYSFIVIRFLFLYKKHNLDKIYYICKLADLLKHPANITNSRIMRKLYLLLLTLLFPTFLFGQIYKYIGVENGLSNRRVYCIQKDAKGYMWFLTHDGIDRYNGKEFKTYRLMDGDQEMSAITNLNWLYLGPDNALWEIGKQGRVFRYDDQHDTFRLIYKLPATATQSHVSISYGFIDQNCTIWLCNEEAIYLYHHPTQKTTVITNKIGENITDVVQIDSTHYFIGTDIGIHYAELKNNKLQLCPCDKLDYLKIQVNEIYYHQPANKVFIGTFQRGVYVYDLNKHEVSPLNAGLTDVSINCIKALNYREILIATDGAGIYKVQTDNLHSEPYIVADYNSNNAMNGNTINDIYIDDEQRIWIANYPIGITVRNNRYESYKWIKHSIGNKQSLINDQVNAIIEDHEGDLWFATNNGISLYEEKKQKWYSFLNETGKELHNKNHTFVSICEVSPGIIWIGGYSSGIYEINKQNKSVDFFSPSLYGNLNARPDKYIRSIIRTSDGKIWSGGYYNLKEIDFTNNKIRYFDDVNGITTILEKDENHLWIGTTSGLHLLEKSTGKIQNIPMPFESYYVYSLYQSKNGKLYIGTNNAGLLVYNPVSATFEHYNAENSSLISNNIYCILSAGEEEICLSTENGLTNFNPQKKIFQNWTKEQGLKSDHFNAASGVLRRNGNLIFGSTDGAIEFNHKFKIPQNNSYKMILSDLKVFYQTVYPNEKDSPLTTDINETKVLRLKYNQNIFSINVSSICYDYPSQILYSWKLDGFYDIWSRPDRENTIYFTNLDPGEYTLRIRLISNENKSVILEEREMQIIIEQPIWLSHWAMLIYGLICMGILSIILRILIMKKQRKISEEKIQFFINTAHDIRTPLTLIKAPLEEIAEHESLSAKANNSMQTALRNVNALLRLTTNLINFERADTYSGNLYVTEYELSNYIEEVVNVFSPYADIKKISLTQQNNFQLQNVWIDKDKMDSILKNLISNAIKYTPEGGSVEIITLVNDSTWSVEVKDTGIGIPASEQKKMFKMHFRSSNAINSKITGSGIGLLLVWKLVRIHKGKLSFSSIEGKGSSVKVTFPISKKLYHKAISQPSSQQERPTYTQSKIPLQPIPVPASPATSNLVNSLPQVLIVEDNDELREYLQDTLADEYSMSVCNNGKTALEIIKEAQPDLIISDIMMPEMRGDDLCKLLKNDIETSHIPIILLTALNAEKNIIKGLQTGADEYIVKPFNIGILRATIANILNNRAILKQKYASLDINSKEANNENKQNVKQDLDWKFMSSVKEQIEKNLNNPEFNVDKLCALLNMSRTSFYNKLKTLTDQAPADYIRLIRLQHAAQLLREQQYNVTEVAEMTGFSDAKYFREVFKKHYNISPSQYAKKQDTP